MKNIILIGLCGGSASGKTTIAQNMKNNDKKEIDIISMDSYYKSYDELDISEKRKINYDHPDAFDVDLIVEQLRMIKSGQIINIPKYSYEMYKREMETIKMEPKQFMVIEGILILHFLEIRELLDYTFFIEADEKTRLSRMIERDIKERGRTADWVIYQYFRDMKLMNEQYIEPQKELADCIIDSSSKRLEEIIVFITDKLEKMYK